MLEEKGEGDVKMRRCAKKLTHPLTYNLFLRELLFR